MKQSKAPTRNRYWWSSKFVTARVYHNCGGCTKRIMNGHVYLSFVAGEWQTYPVCLECTKLERFDCQAVRDRVKNLGELATVQPQPDLPL